MDSGKLIKVEALPREGDYNVNEQMLEFLRRMANIPGFFEKVVRCTDRMPDVERYMSTFEERCRATMSRCDALEMLCRTYVCPGNVNYSQPTLDQYSGLNQVKLSEIVTMAW